MRARDLQLLAELDTNGALDELFDATRESIKDQWTRSQNASDRDSAWQRLQGLNEARRTMRAHITTMKATNDGD